MSDPPMCHVHKKQAVLVPARWVFVCCMGAKGGKQTTPALTEARRRSIRAARAAPRKPKTPTDKWWRKGDKP